MTTGRRRRCGWLDLVVAKYSHLINGYSSFNLTKLDVLDQLPELKIATSYEINGEVHETFPADLGLLENEKVKVHYETLPGWQEDISKCRKYEELPRKCKDYVEFIEKFLGVPIEWIGVGPGRDSMIRKSA